MNSRLNIFLNYKSHAHFGKLYKKLSISEIQFCVNFLSSNNNLNKSDFEYKVNRMFLDIEKPKHWKEIVELLACCNI